MRLTEYSLQINDGIPYLVKEKSSNFPGLKANSPEALAEIGEKVMSLNRMAEEYLYAIALSMKCRVLGVFQISHGTVSSSSFMSREIFIRMLLAGAAHFVVMHNHPSGEPTPSTDDIRCTEKVREIGLMMGLPLLDHIIIGAGEDSEFYSFTENGLL